MLFVSLFSLVLFSFGMLHVQSAPSSKSLELYYNDNSENNNNNNLELGPNISEDEDDEDDDLRKVFLISPSLIHKRGVDPLSIPRLIKEPPLKKRSGFEMSQKRGGDSVYPSAAKQTVPLIRVREPPLKRGQLYLEKFLNFNEAAHQRFYDPIQRIRYRSRLFW